MLVAGNQILIEILLVGLSLKFVPFRRQGVVDSQVNDFFIDNGNWEPDEIFGRENVSSIKSSSENFYSSI